MMSRPRMATCTAAAACVLAMAAWLLTGMEGFTRWPNERLEQADQATSRAEQDLLDELGIGTTTDAPTGIQSRFAFGLLPGGIDPRHAISVATVCTAAAATAAASRLISYAHARRTKE